MEIPFATTFSEYVNLLAVNSPHALVMDWWRRLDLALHEYDHSLRQVVGPRNSRAIEEAVSLDRALGPGISDSIRWLRLLRNQVAHESIYNLSSEDAADYARHVFTLIGALGRRISSLEKPNRGLSIPQIQG
jgi:hypothetical protein